MPSEKKQIIWAHDTPIGLKLQCEIVGADMRFKSVYWGMKPADFLIFKMPASMPETRDLIFSRCNMIVRYIVDGKVHGFHTSVVGHVMNPTPMFFVTYPKTLEVINLRKTERVDTFIEAKGENEEMTSWGMILDLSEEGCLFSIDKATGLQWPPIEKGDEFELEFKLTNSPEPLVVHVEVVMIRKADEKADAGLRFHFSADDDENKNHIAEYINAILEFKKGPSA